MATNYNEIIRKAADQKMSEAARYCGELRLNGASAEEIDKAMKDFETAKAEYEAICLILKIPAYAFYSED